CNIGKMTTQLQLRDAMRARGMRVGFAPTGQTGILVEGWGISVDAVIADFIAGAAERLTLHAAKDADIVLVEGQGSIIHPSYSGVTYGLLHGSLPHAMVMCAQPSRTAINNHGWVKIPPLPEFIDMQERAAAPLRPAPVIAVALNTYDLSDADTATQRSRSHEDLSRGIARLHGFGARARRGASPNRSLRGRRNRRWTERWKNDAAPMCSGSAHPRRWIHRSRGRHGRVTNA